MRSLTTAALTRPIARSRAVHRANQTPTARCAWPPPSGNGKLESRRAISAYGYTQAKALVYSRHGEPKDVLRLHTHSISPAHSNQVTIRFLTAPINPADINQIQGVYPTKPPFTSSLGTPTPSAVAGNEGVAEVVSAGSQVKDLARGDWVVMAQTGFGTWRTHAQADAARVVKIADKTSLSPTQVGTVSVNPCTAYRMLRDFVRLDAGAGDWFIQNGANSGVGRAAIQLGRLWGYKSINVVRDREDAAALDALRDELHALGADVVVTESELLDGRRFAEKVKEWTRGGREHVRLGLNCVGGKSATALAKTLSTPSPDAGSAQLVTYGAMAKQPVMLPAGLLIFKNVAFSGFWISQWSDHHLDEKRRMVEEILDLTRKGEFRDIPVREVRWAETEKGDSLEQRLKREVQSALEGFRDGKGVFVFPNE